MKNLTFIVSLMLIGCSGAKVRKQVVSEIAGIVQRSGDCEATCEAVKVYVANEINKQAK